MKKSKVAMWEGGKVGQNAGVQGGRAVAERERREACSKGVAKIKAEVAWSTLVQCIQPRGQ